MRSEYFELNILQQTHVNTPDMHSSTWGGNDEKNETKKHWGLLKVCVQIFDSKNLVKLKTVCRIAGRWMQKRVLPNVRSEKY